MSTTAATSALQKAHDAVDQRDFRQALGYALDARERAKESARQAADGKARRAVAAEARIATYRRESSSSKRGSRPPTPPVWRTRLQDNRASLARREKVLQKARTTFGAGDYQQAAEI